MERVNDVTPQPTDDPRVFLLPDAPNPPASLQLFCDGNLQYSGIQFNLEGNQIALNFIPRNSWMRAWYTK